MKNVVYKYPLNLTDIQFIDIPGDYEILHVAEQGWGLCLWAHVDSYADKERKTVLIIGTGHKAEIDPGVFRFIGTVLMQSGLVFHVWFEN